MGSRKSWNQKKGPSKVEVSLTLECGNPPLSEFQLAAKNKDEEEFNQFMKKFTESLSKRNAEVIEKKSITVYEIDCTPNFPVSVIQQDVPTTGLIKPTPTSTLLATTQPSLISSNSVLLPSGTVASSGSPVFSSHPPTTYQLVVGPRMGLIVTPSTPAPTNAIPSSPSVNSTPPLITTRPTVASRVQVRPGLGNMVQQPKRFVTPTAPTPPPAKITVNPATQKNTPPAVPKVPAPVVTSTVNTRSKGKLNSRTPDTNNVESVQSKITTSKAPANAVSSSAVVDLTEDDGKPAADSKEVSFNRFPGRIYPSLVVVARPNLKAKEMTSSMITAERTQLDTKVKGILTNSPTKFTEWLIQQGLVRSEQVCNNHLSTDIDSVPRKLKLGMYSDVSKFPYSGGYVWISDCCPQKFVSVFCNSIFEGAPHAPTVLLKLMYHWACQTNVHNIISWVKVDNLYIKNFFTNLRAVCTAAICEKFGKMGGLGKKIEVGVISLGTTSQNGSVRQVKVEVLGIMDPSSKFIRLRAVDPVQNAEKNHKLRFSRILESLEQWVDKRTTIVTDYTVDRATLNELGFHSVIQAQLNSQSRENNQAVMDYLKRVVPRMFQNTLSLLSRSIIQQFLDELVWRERWGPIASRAFDNLVLHLSEMTRLDSGDTLINRLKSITANPFRDWKYSNWKTHSGVAFSRKINHVDLEASKQTVARAKVNGPNIAPKPNLVTAGKSAAKSMVTLALDDSSDDAGGAFSSSDIGQSGVIDLDDDNVSVSSTSSRRSRNRGSLNDDRLSTSSMLKQWTDMQPVLKSLETYYYGTLPPDGVVINKLKKVDLNMKCFGCGLTYQNNIQFMKHLAGHAQDEGAFTTEHQCRYCLKNFTSAFDLEDHKGSTHLTNKYNAMCLICNERFRHRGALINHMQTTHTELELPYQCNICKFRSSVHTEIVDHFYEVHDGGEKVQCPFCLKTVSFESASGTKIPQNVKFFFDHLQRHQKKPVRKCNKCVLSFVHKKYLNDHRKDDHASRVNMTGVIRHQFMDMSTVLMPVPSSMPQLNRKGKPVPISVPNFSTYKLDNTLFYPDMAIAKCLECKTDVIGSQHFTSYLTCMKCMFGSCCKVIMSRHMEKFHEFKGKRKHTQRKSIPLKKPLYCVCGFSSSCGNEMASHLVHCKRRIAYPNPERAAQYAVQMQSASFPPLVNLDDMEPGSDDASNKWLRAFVKNSSSTDDEAKSKRMAISENSPPRMLRELGLVRKESSSVESDSSAVKAPERDDTDSDGGRTSSKQASSSRGKSKVKKSENEDDVQNVEESPNDTEDEIEPPEADDSCSSEKNNDTNTSESASKTDNDAIAIAEAEEAASAAEFISKSVAESDAISASADENIAVAKSASSVPVSADEISPSEETSAASPVVMDAENVASVAADKSPELIERIDETVESDKEPVSTDLPATVPTRELESAAAKPADEDLPMETEELSPATEKMDGLEENPVAMECEENVDEQSKMVVDSETQDGMMVD